MVTWTEEDLRNYERKFKGYTNTHGSLNPKASALVTQLSDPIPQQAGGDQLVEGKQAKEASKGRITVRITRLGTKLLDEDNLAGAKLIIDELRYAKLIPSDDAGTIKIELLQCKVSKAQIGVLIEIIP